MYLMIFILISLILKGRLVICLVFDWINEFSGHQYIHLI
jgi:hypothetical protein